MKKLRSYAEERKIREDGDGKQYVCCDVRNRDLVLTPEEEVRQDVLTSLCKDYGYLSLRSEVPVAPGTEDRGRADVVVYLPADIVAKHEVKVRATPSSELDSQWSELSAVDRRKALEVRLAKRLEEKLLAAFRIVECPDCMTIEVDGSKVNFKCLGFMDAPGGIALALKCVSDAKETFGFPKVIRLRIFGRGLSELELDVRDILKLGRKPFDFDSVKNVEFSRKSIYALAPSFCRPFNEEFSSEQGFGGGQ